MNGLWKGKVDGWMSGWMDWSYRWVRMLVGGRMGGWAVGPTDRWMDRCKEMPKNYILLPSFRD